jgi:hypothetical protein
MMSRRTKGSFGNQFFSFVEDFENGTEKLSFGLEPHNKKPRQGDE